MNQTFFVNFVVMVLCRGELLVSTGVRRDGKLPRSWVSVLCMCQRARGKGGEVRSFRQRLSLDFGALLLLRA